MNSPTIQFITRTKLAELSRQRESLLSQYQQIADEAAAGDAVAGLQILYDGLKNIRAGMSQLHRELPNLKVLLHGTAPPELLVAFWREKLLREVQRGRRRADVVYLFGAFLGEWDDQDDAQRTWQEENRRQRQQLLRQVTGGADQPLPTLKFLLRQLETLAPHHSRVPKETGERLTKSLAGEFGYYGPYKRIADSHHPSEVRMEARRFCDEHILAEQCSAAIAIASRDPRVWDWPAAGVPARAIWTRNKWRLYPTLSLVDLCVLDCSGSFWSSTLDGCYTWTAKLVNRAGRLQKLIDLGAPEVIVTNDRRMLEQELERVRFDWDETVDPWTQEPAYSAEKPAKGIVLRRAELQSNLRESSEKGYGYGEGSNPMVRQVQAETRLLQAAFPDRPLHVVKLDIRDYFPSVPHETLRTMLRVLGTSDDGMKFVDRYLAVPYQRDGEVVRAARGVPMEQPFSHWLCEWLMRMLEQHVHARANVRIIRQIDDICLLAPAAKDALSGWRAAREFIEDCGLLVNDEKSGAVTIGGPAVAELPATNPHWGMLELNAGGDWQTHAATFEKFLGDARREVASPSAVLAKVITYNQHLKFLGTSLGVAMDLGDRHRQSVNEALRRFETEFFEDGAGIFDGLRARIAERYRDRFDAIPTSWLVWPITAGGLGLRSATIIGGQYQIAYEVRREARKTPPAERPADWQVGHAEWTEFYEDLLVDLKPAECAESKTMNAMVESFIQRGKTISGGKQEGLSQYWRWVLSIHGPEILEQLGTFEFLLTELVPLQLIQEKLIRAESSETEA